MSVHKDTLYAFWLVFMYFDFFGYFFKEKGYKGLVLAIVVMFGLN